MRAAALLDTDPAAAAREAEAILDAAPGHAAALLLLGTARRSSGHLEAAADTLGALAATQPESAVMQLELARTLGAQGDRPGAERALRRALELQGELAQAWRELSVLRAAAGDSAECDRAWARYAALSDDDAHLAEAAAALAQGRLTHAEALLEPIRARAPQDVAALRLAAEVAAAREDYPRAEQLLTQCLGLAPGYSRARLELVRVYDEQQKAADMLPLLERLLVLDPANSLYRTLQASAHAMLGQHEQALAILEAQLAADPRAEWLWLHYGHLLRGAGRTADAVAAYRRAAALRAQFGEAWFSLANLKTMRFSAADLAAMRAQLARSDLKDTDRLQFEFALGKALEDEADYEQSFGHYARGNALRRAAVRYDAEAASSLMQRTQRLFTREFLEARRGSGDPAPDPIFILGMPRSGSTLLEQILATHSQVEGTRELFDVRGIALGLGLREDTDAAPAYPQSIAQLTRAQLAACGARYLSLTRPVRHSGRPHFIDKMPLNFLHVGLIHLMLPNARIIDVRRAPLACCFANFKQHFQRGGFFSYDQAELGRYYRDYAALMAHFERVLPGRVLRVDYERLVTDLEGEVRRVLQYCGLPFEAQCLRFYENRRVVQTPSSEQVRRPVYAEGLNQWRHFEPWLGPLKQALGELAADP